MHKYQMITYTLLLHFIIIYILSNNNYIKKNQQIILFYNIFFPAKSVNGDICKWQTREKNPAILRRGDRH